ncbi:MAG: hypothetical protein U9R58_06865 [Chloroflexota bacterium]|nr:hypothetical protein [Chloroflexota bacterium]
MKKMTVLDRIVLLVTGLFAAYQVVVGVDNLGTLAMTSYTIAFGVLLVACLLLLILGWEILDNSLIVIVSTIIPLSLSLGLIAEYYPEFTNFYLAFTVVGFLAVIITRYIAPGRVAVIVLAVVHGVAGLTIFLLPIILTISGETSSGFLLVSLGGALIGIGGLLLSFLKTGSPILSREQILTILSWLLLIMTACYVAGFALS